MWALAVQLYGVRSARNWGHGDFTDLLALVDLAAELGAAGVGLNPLHALFDDRPSEPSPYFASSRLFLNPIYIDPEAVPEFPGLHTHERALQAGVARHGCTVHFVTADLDHGPIVIQAAVPVRAGDTPQSLAARVLKQEHVIYPRAVRWFLDGKLVIEGDRVRVRGEKSEENAQLVISAD